MHLHFLLFTGHTPAFAVIAKLRSVHALDRCEPFAVMACLGYRYRVFNDILAPWQVIDEEMRGQVFRTLIIPDTTTPLVSAQYIHRFKPGGAHIFEMNKLHVAIRLDDKSHNQFVSHLQCITIGSRGLFPAILVFRNQQGARHLQWI